MDKIKVDAVAQKMFLTEGKSLLNEVYCSGVPITQGNHSALWSWKTLKHRIVDKSGKELIDWRNGVGLLCKQQMPCEPVSGPVRLHIDFVYQRPASQLGMKGPRKSFAYWKKTRPDCDKILRAIFDALTGIVYIDDQQVVDVSARKFYAYANYKPGVYISAVELPDSYS